MLVKHGNKIFVCDAFFEESLLQPFARIVDEFVKTVPIGAQPFSDLVQGHSLKSVSDERGSLQGRELGIDEARQ